MQPAPHRSPNGRSKRGILLVLAILALGFVMLALLFCAARWFGRAHVVGRAAGSAFGVVGPPSSLDGR